MDSMNLERFIRAQEHSYAAALAEVKAGRKKSHWMWYFFPQLAGLGRSETAAYYAIQNLDEARAYMDHPLLSARLQEICQALLYPGHPGADIIFGFPDNLKLHSCMTLFAEACPGNRLFRDVLDQYFDGRKDAATLRLLHLP